MAEDFDVRAMQVLRQMGLSGAANFIGQAGATMPGERLGGEGFKTFEEPRPFDRTPEQRQRASFDVGMNLGPGVVKQAGGNWSPEALDLMVKYLTRETGQHNPEMMAWAQRAARNYLNRYAGTERDPLRDMILQSNRTPGHQRSWEEITDKVFMPRTAEEVVGRRETRRMTNDPALGKIEDMLRSGKIDPTTEFWDLTRRDRGYWPNYTNQGTRRMFTTQLGHTGAYMRQRLEQAAQYDLPRAIRESPYPFQPRPVFHEGLRPPQANADAMLAELEGRAPKSLSEQTIEQNLKGTTPYKKYEGGMQWVEVGPEGLRNEGQRMGHCVGGYCDQVEMGGSKIYSLRDAKGEPHVTIEVRPREPDFTLSNLVREAGTDGGHAIWKGWHDYWYRNAIASGQRSHALPFSRWIEQEHPDVYEKIMKGSKEDIYQIKGKGNAAPVEKYLPQVQDFVKSGNWGKVGELENAGLAKHPLDPSKFITTAEAEAYRRMNLNRRD